jgi:threonine dehydrogenase-like Zn-dependent dehydrogenase
MAETDRPIAISEAIMACRNGWIVSVLGVYGGLIDKFPIGSFMNRSLSMRTGQTHVQHYWRALLDHIERGDVDPALLSLTGCT